MTGFCASKGIQQRFSAPYAQWMDHTAERNVRTIGEMAVTTLVHSNLPKSAWGHAVMHAIDVINRTSESADINKSGGFPNNFSRLEKWKGHELPGQTKALYPFGCLAFKHIPAAVRTKLDHHATPVVYLGIDAKSRSYLLGSLFDLDLSTSVDVTFMENVFPFRKFNKYRESPASLLWGTENNLAEGDPRLGMFDSSDTSGVSKILDQQALKAIGALPAEKASSNLDDSEIKHNLPSELSQPVRKSGRARQPSLAAIESTPDRDVPPDPDPHATLMALTESSLQTITPKTAQQAVESKSREYWIEAMNREKECHLKNGTFGEEWDGSGECPKAIPAGWVFKIKHRGPPIEEVDLKPKQFKARVVIRGQYMKEGLDYNDTFAPVAKPMTLRAVLAIATKYGCKLKSGDVETAFLASDMDCEVWVKMPMFWGKGTDTITGGAREELPPRKLLKGVPGIPQGSRLFFETFSVKLKEMGWVSSSADKCLFLNATLQEKTAVVLWVDDFIFMHEEEETWTAFIGQLRTRFTIPLVGPLVSFLGMDIEYNPVAHTMFISQANAIASLLERARMSDCNPAPTPCQPAAVFTNKDCPETVNAQMSTEYRSLIAMANFISCWTRPDITFTVNKLCKYMSKPGEAHWKGLKQLLRYLKGTQRKGLYYNFGLPGGVLGLHGYTDASYADCPDTSKSTIAYVFFYSGAILSWYSKLHTFVTTCTNHSEYAALATGAKEAQWMVFLFQELEPHNTHTPVPMYVDSSGVISMVFNPWDHQANKHVRLGCHYARELTAEGIISPQRVPTEKNLADLFTKSLGGVTFKALVGALVDQPQSVRGGVLANSLISL
jgi:histone deacetylase 1/2